MVTSIDTSVLLGYYQSRAGLTGSAGLLGASAGPAKKVAPTAPWSTPTAAADLSAAVKAAIAGRKFVNENGAKLDLPGASEDYRKLFALYQGLGALNGVAEQAGAKGLLDADRTRLDRAFTRGLNEITDYLGDLDLDKLRMVQGEVASTAKTVGIQRTKTDYTTPPLVAGSAANVPDAFQGAVKFSISVKRATGAAVNVNIDLAGMGAQTRSLQNVVSYMNDQLKAAGVDARFATQRIPGGDKTTTINGKSVKIGTNPDQYAMKVNVSTGETLSFQAAATAGAVYVAQDAGNPDPDGKKDTNDSTAAAQFLKFQTDTTTVPSPLQRSDEPNWVDGRVFAKTLGPEVKTIRDQKVGSDGSVYMLADVTKKIAGQDIKGDQDVALLKYDAAGNLLFARTLGAADEASGLGLALSADGKIAVAGSVKGVLNGATDGPLNSTGSDNTDSFVTVYNSEGEELWTQRRGARMDDEASDVAFGADGTVYVSGKTNSVLPGATPVGGSDSYLQAFKQDATGKVNSLFTTSFGTTGADKPAGMVVDGTSVITASIENGHAILRRFDVSGAAPVLSSSRDLGDLKGGSIAGLAMDGGQLVIAGSTSNGSLNAGTVTKAIAGGADAFAARIDANLGPGGQIAYYGGAGEDQATSLAVANGQVWIGGSAGKDLPNYPNSNMSDSKDGFLAQIDVGAGSVAWSRRFTGKDGRAAPTAIAVDTTGASVLDRIGLPKGELDLTDSQQLTAATSLRAGDTFTIKSALGRTNTVTIEAKDTLDTLATKIRRASDYQAKVSISTVDGKRTLKVEPLTDRSTLEFGAGKTDKDALAMLGIPEGIVRKTTMVNGKSTPADGRGPLYGLGLAGDLSLSTEVERKRALTEIDTALTSVRIAYRDLVAAASPKTAQQTAAAAASGPVPAYLTNQIANYQAALSRLTGGG